MGVPCTATFAFLFLVLIFSLYFNFCRFTYNVSCCGLLWLVGEICSVVSNSLQPHRLYSPWNSPGQNTGVGSHSLLEGIFPTQGSNPGLPHCRWILYQLSHNGSLWTSLSISHLSLSFLRRYACLFPFQVSECFQLLLIK